MNEFSSFTGIVHNWFLQQVKYWPLYTTNKTIVQFVVLFQLYFTRRLGSLLQRKESVHKLLEDLITITTYK